jgi:gibberellin A4 carboxyl methyltransferase
MTIYLENPHVPVTTGMKGGGFYDDHSAPQMATIAAVLPWLEDAVGQMELATPGGPVVVADFGCSEGRNSIAAAGRIIAAVRARDRRPIQTVHSDLPTNNFNQLFANLYPIGQPVFPGPDVFSAAVGGSMFDQLLPPNTVAVASTYNAIGFLNRRPAVSLPDYILPMGPGRPRPGVDVALEALQTYAAQAREDLARFYSARATELVPGGKLLVASFGIDERYRTCDGLYDVLNDALLDLVASSRLLRESYEQLVFPIYFRTAEELVEPVAGANPGLAERFRLDRVDSMEVTVPFNQRLERTGDVPAYAREFTEFLRAFTEPIVRMTFAEEPALDSLIVDLYSGVEARLAADPSGYAFHYIQVAALLTKR